MERVEDAVDEPGLAPSVDVNDNREECKPRVCGSDPERAREGSVYSSAYANPGGAGLPSLPPVEVGYRAGVLNGFPGKLEVDMVCVNGEGGEGDRVTGTSEAECWNKSDRNYLNSQPKSAVSFMGINSLNMKMPNGDVIHEHMDLDPTHLRCLDYAEGFKRKVTALDQGVKVGNGGLLIVNSYDTLSQVPFRAVGGLLSPESCVFVHQSDSVLSTGRSCATAESSEETLSDLSAKLSFSPLAENTSDYTETEPSPEEDFSDTGPPPFRPQNLRTNSGHTVSLSCDATPLSPGDDGYFGAFEGSRRKSAPDRVAVDPDASYDQTLGTKRQGIAEFLTRSLFSWKPKESKGAASHSVPGWKLFGKIPLRDNPLKNSRTVQQEYESGPPTHLQPMRRKNLEFEPLSTTALILEDRPPNLPAKSEEESQRHRQEYSEMVAGAKRREMKEAQKKKRQMKERYRQEENIANAMVIWNMEVLPNWESMRNTRRVRDLWWQGVPPSVRGKVWILAIGNELNITPELYEIFLSRAKEKWRSFSEMSSVNENEECGVSLADRESSLDLIKLDISRTFPSLYIFQKGGPYHDILHSLLGAYTCYRPDVGYVQGMSFIAAVLILNLEEADAFIAFANLLNKPCQMAFFRVDHDLMLKYFAAFEVFFEENLPKLFQHFQNNSLTPDFYLIDWIFTLYSKSLPLDVACRVWDVFCRDGEEALFRTGLGILRLYQDVLLQMDFIHSAQFLSRLPENTPAHTLFSCIANTQMISNNRRWNQVFSALIKDGLKETDKSSSSNSPALRS
ncbi:TBC1 domain family member 12-like [Carassius carassius]|uniref:TBC1 domain family member 12-like n=1 Tax=Carassius carassius TaxID=217509 RepID=UPI0028697CFE|nr:TBC1 domain family member 12-like [Carassius carassius]